MRNPWSWVPSLFAAEEIPAAIVTYVALLMFLQAGMSSSLSTLLSALLFLPWVLKSFIRSWVLRAGHFRQMLHVQEICLSASFLALSLSFTYGAWLTFIALMVISFLCAWHELTSRMYYESMLHPRMQRFYIWPKNLFAHISIVITYGALIMIVGSLQVFFRMIPKAWSMGCYIIAGIFMAFTLYHLLVLCSPSTDNIWQRHSMISSVKDEIHVIQRIREQKTWWHNVLSIFLLLLPQSLMFYSRVLFLFDKQANGGLECTMQEIGFAQGTIGVLAFSLGIYIGQRLTHWIPARKLAWPLAFVLGLSPCAYLLMTFDPPSSLPILCIATFQAQLLFGLGLNACRNHLKQLSGNRYNDTINLLYIPMVALCMIMPMAMSGIMVEKLGYRTFFLLDALSAPVCWGFLKTIQHMNRKHIVTFIFLLVLFPLKTLAVTFTREDSTRVVALLEEGAKQQKGTNLMLFYAHKLQGVPYVASTLEVNSTEQLVVNLHQLDCTTLVETVTALALTTKNGGQKWSDFCKWLTTIRYRDGKLDGYTSRNHYFSQWIQSNQKMGIVEEKTSSSNENFWPFVATQTLDLHYMSQHPDKYPMLTGKSYEIKKIKERENELKGVAVRYIPCSLLNKGKDELTYIKDGDILAIVTQKDGLDTSHIGLAEWGKDGKLHLLNASSIHHKVVLEPMTLQQYMAKHPSQLGVRVIRVL